MTRADSRTGEESNPAPDARKYLVFQIGPFWLALDIKAIKRVHDAEGIPPRSPGSRVLDLHHLTGSRADRAPGYWLEMEIGGSRFLAPVEEVEEISELSLAIPMEYPPALRREETKPFARVFFDGLRMIAELDAPALAEAENALPPSESFEEESEPETESPRSDRVAILEIGGDLWRLDLANLVQVINRDEVHPLPSGGAEIDGVVYYADRAVPVVGPAFFRRLCDGAVGSVETYACIALVETGSGLIGLGCERIVEVVGRSAAAARSHVGKTELSPARLVYRLKRAHG